MQRIHTLIVAAIVLTGCGVIATPPDEVTSSVAPSAVVSPVASPSAEAGPTAVPIETPSAEPTTVPSSESSPAGATATPAMSDVPAPDSDPTTAPTAISTTSGFWIRAGSQLVQFSDQGQQTIDLNGDREPWNVYSFALSPDGATLSYIENAGASTDLVLRDLATGEIERIAGVSFEAVFAPDSRSIAYGTLNGSLYRTIVRDLASGAEQVLHEGTIDNVVAPIAWTPAGLFAQKLIIGSDAPPQSLVVYDPASGAARVVRSESHVQAILTDDGSRAALVTGYYSMGGIGEAGLAVVDTASGSEQQIVPDHTGLIAQVGWSTDNAQLAYVMAAEFDMPPLLLHAINADGSNDRTVNLADSGVAMLHSMAWHDAGTLLLLTSDREGAVQVLAVDAATLDLSHAEQVATFEPLPQGASAQILRAAAE